MALRAVKVLSFRATAANGRVVGMGKTAHRSRLILSFSAFGLALVAVACESPGDASSSGDTTATAPSDATVAADTTTTPGDTTVHADTATSADTSEPADTAESADTAEPADTSEPPTDTSVVTDTSTDRCDNAGLVWKTANKTNYESYPDPDSEECIEFSGCDYIGQFAECDNTMPESWVASHDIVALFPLGNLGLHELCVRKGAKTMVVTVIDTCGDNDCDGCCTENRGDADALIDMEKYTNQRWGLDDGPIEWADLGKIADDSFDGCND